MLPLHNGYVFTKKFFGDFNSSSYDTVVRLTTFGQDEIWKKNMIRLIPNNKIVLDLACGTGILSSMLIRKRECKVFGLDLTYDYLQVAKRQGFPIINGTAEMLPYRQDIFDAVVSSYLAKYIDPRILVKECWRVLKHNGIAVFHDFTFPSNQLMQNLWHYYFIILKIIGHVAKSWKTVFQDLGGLVQNSRWTEDIVKSLRERGFVNIECKYYTFGTASIILAVKP